MNKMVKRYYNLPDGTITTSGSKYCIAWEALAAPIYKATGAEIHSFDPDIAFIFKGKVFDMPTQFIEALNKALNA